MTTPYSPDTAAAQAIGATSAGYIELTDPSWDAGVASFNGREMNHQAGLFACMQRDALAQLRKQLLPAPASQVKILTCGDSITYGYGSADGKGYPAWLADQIDQQRVKPVMSMCAHSGWYLADLKNNIGVALTANTPDIVTIDIGTNDYDFTTAYTTGTYGALVDQILASSATVKVACALLSISQQASIAAHEQSANAVIQQVVNARLAGGRVALSDQTTATQARWQAEPTNPQPTRGRWTIDGIHPTDAGYAQKARAWFNTIQPWIPGTTAI